MRKWLRFIQLDLWGRWLRIKLWIDQHVWRDKTPAFEDLMAVRRWETQVRRWKERWR